MIATDIQYLEETSDMTTLPSRPASKLPLLTLLFWVMKIAATTLGETAGDLFSMTLHVGYLVSTIVLTRPFGATMGDVLTKDTGAAGLGFGTIDSSGVLAALLVSVILYTMWRERGHASHAPAA